MLKDVQIVWSATSACIPNPEDGTARRVPLQVVSTFPPGFYPAIAKIQTFQIKELPGNSHTELIGL